MNGGGHAGMAGDAYRRHLSSRRYREERAGKAEVIYQLCGPRLTGARRLADLGAGTGLIKKALEAKIDKSIVGFELDIDFIEDRRGMVVADVCRLPVDDGALDFLLLNHLYEHVEDQSGLFREAFRVLGPRGSAYVAAGNRLAVIEPHYRLPFLSWLPAPAADRYLRWTGRGGRYRGVRFLTRRPLVRMMEEAGFRVLDLTEDALALLDGHRGSGWRPAGVILRALPGRLRRFLLQWASPQWFFLLEKPRDPSGGTPRGTRGGRRE